MNTVFLGLITLAFIVAVVIFIIVFLELRGAIKGLKELVGTTERSIRPTLAELQETLKRVRIFTDNVNDAAENAKVFSDSLRGVGESVKSLSENVKRVSRFVEEITSSTVVEASSLKAGVKAGLRGFIKNILKKV